MSKANHEYITAEIADWLDNARRDYDESAMNVPIEID